MTEGPGDEQDPGVRDVSAPGGQAAGINYGTVLQQNFHGQFSRLRDATIDLDPLPGDLQLVDPLDRNDLVGNFTGREWLLTEIDRFIAGCVRDKRGGHLFIEAEAGMGKSALATYLAFTRGWPTHVTRLPGGESPETARANLVAQLIARWALADAAPDGVLPAGHDTTLWLYKRLCDAARQRDRNKLDEAVVLLVDGLDEAPTPLNGQLPLGLPKELPSGTVIVATTRPGTTLPPGLGRVRRIEVESQENRDDLHAFLLRATTRDNRLVTAIAQAEMRQMEFCLRLEEHAEGIWIYAISVLDEIRIGRPASDVNTLPPGLAGYYANNIARWRADPAISWDAVTLPILGMLSAVRAPQPASVLAQWAGLPPSRVTSLLRGRLKPFLMTRPGGDPDVYGLRHQSLRDFCEGRLEPSIENDQLRELSYDLAQATHAAQAQIVQSILLSAGPIGTREWSPHGDYARLYLIEHAARIGKLEELVLDPEFLLLVRLPDLLRERQRGRVTSMKGRAAIAVVELASKSWDHEHTNQLRWLEVSARALRCDFLAIAASQRLRASWVARAAVWRVATPNDRAGHTGPVMALAAVPLPDGSTWLASGGFGARPEGAVQVWDPFTLGLRRQLSGHRGQVSALTTVPLSDGRTLLASAGDDRIVRLWDLSTLAAPVELTGHTDWLRAVAAVPLPDGRTLLASASIDGSVRLWDPVTGIGRGQLTGNHGSTRALMAVPMSNESTLVATAGDDGSIQLWEPLAAARSGKLAGHATGVNALAAVQLPDGRTLLASAGDDGSVRLWDPVTETEHGELVGHSGSVNALATIQLPDGKPLLASVGNDRSLRLWDPLTATSRGKLIGHTGAVNAICVISVANGHALLASGDRASAVIVWEKQDAT